MGADEDFWGDILAHLKQRVLVPVVGPQLLTVVENDRQLSLSRVIGERLAQRSGLSVAWHERSGLDDAVRAYVAAKGSDRSDRLYRVVNDILSELAPAPPESLQNLARITDVPLFISTTFDALLARAIDDGRFDGQHLTRELWFSPNQSTTAQQDNARLPAAHEVVVFKLFGEASSTPQYAIHEEDVLEWLHALLTDTARLPEWLGYRLRESPLLFVGCEMPDWIGRFLIRLTSKTRLSLAGNQVFIVGRETSPPASLATFFSTFCGSTRVQLLDADPVAFCAELRERWERRRPSPTPARTSAPAPLHGGIFISYVREDGAAARRLADAIAAIGGDVWLDERRLQPGDHWESEILDGIRQEVRLFVPLISACTEQRDEGYVFREWAQAVERAKGIPRRRFIVPVVIDVDYAGNPAHYRQVPSEFTHLQFGRAPGGIPDSALTDALTAEIRAMRRSDTP